MNESTPEPASDELLPLTRQLMDRVAPPTATGALLNALELTAADYRDSYRRSADTGLPYLHLPYWMVVVGGGWDPFCERFEQSIARRPLPFRGFEVDAPNGQTLRYTLARYRPPQDESPA